MASLAAPLESQFSTIAGVTSITSLSAAGRASIRLEFEQKKTRDAAAPDLRSAISAASATLPPDLPEPPSIVVREGDH
jgi:HAE1 family hydrophobic/amphiphilic exporter-1